MIKNYKQYNESLLDKLKGPSKEDVENFYYEKEIKNILDGGKRRIMFKNWDKSYDSKSILKKIQRDKQTMVEVETRIQKDIDANKRLTRWIWGYVENSKNSVSRKVVFYVLPTKEQYTSYVLTINGIDGELVWLIYDNNLIYAGGSDEYREDGIKLYNLEND